MKLISRLIVLVFTIAILIIPASVSATQPLFQSGMILHAEGKTCTTSGAPMLFVEF